MRTIITGDIHGAYKALKQCLERSGFDKENDFLIQLGDVCDGFNEVYECVEELLSIKNLIPIKGNHDDWFKFFLQTGHHPDYWSQGGKGTLVSYCKQVDKLDSLDLDYFDLDPRHLSFFLHTQKPYHVDSDNNLFVHGGFNRHFDITDPVYNKPEILMWDRDLWYAALSYGKVEEDDCYHRPKFKMFNNFKEVFIGHTSTIAWKKTVPMNVANIWNLDTGAGYNGVLTFMDLKTKEYWQSDKVNELYTDQKGRN